MDGSFEPVGLTPGESVTTPRKPGWIVVVVVFGVGLPLLPFRPLALSAIEYGLFGTHHVEDFFRAIHLHGALGSFYGAIVDLFR